MLRQGKAKTLLDASIDSALLAVETYNKPRATFRTEAYISLMIMAWTKLFHAHFHHTIGPRYFYKHKNSNRYIRADGEKKAWDLRECMKRYGNLLEPVATNLEFFIRLRNKIEHRHITKREFDILLFGECQALLNNYEAQLEHFFGSAFCLNETLAHSLQFSTTRTDEQLTANKRALSSDMADLKHFVETYRTSLPQELFDSQSYSVKLIQVPKISNTNRHDVAIDFVKWDELDQDDRERYEQLDVLVKDKLVRQPVVNLGGMKPGKLLLSVEQQTGIRLSHYDHKCLYTILSVRPADPNSHDPFDTNTHYCHYDEVHDDYVYYQEWADILSRLLRCGRLKRHVWKQAYKHGRRYNISDFLE